MAPKDERKPCGIGFRSSTKRKQPIDPKYGEVVRTTHRKGELARPDFPGKRRENDGEGLTGEKRCPATVPPWSDAAGDLDIATRDIFPERFGENPLIRGRVKGFTSATDLVEPDFTPATIRKPSPTMEAE